MRKAQARRRILNTSILGLAAGCLLMGCSVRAPVEATPVNEVQFEYSQDFLKALAAPPIMLPGDSLVKQPDLPPGFALRDPPFPFPKPEPEPLPDPDGPIPPDIYNLPPPFEGYEAGPFIPIGEREPDPGPDTPPFVVSDFVITWEAVRTITGRSQTDYFVPNEDELTYNNNHHRLFVLATPTNNRKYTYHVLMNDFFIGSVTHNNLKDKMYFFTVPVLDNFTYLTLFGPGRTTKISFRGASDRGGVRITTSHFDYHKRIRLP